MISQFSYCFTVATKTVFLRANIFSEVRKNVWNTDRVLEPLTKMSVDSIEERLAALQSQWHETGIEALHVMGAFHIIVHHTSAGGPKGFDRVELILLHSGRLTASDNRHRFSGMYAIRRDGVTVQISDRFYLQERIIETLERNICRPHRQD